MTSDGRLAFAQNPSSNAKLGGAATTHAAQESCPDECVFRDGGGCYAETGRQGMFVTRPLNEHATEVGATALDVAAEEADAIDDIDVVLGRPLRLHTVGDCATDWAARMVSRAAERYMERGGGPVWTYTHGWRNVARESWGRVSVIASCETAAEIHEARKRHYAAALVVEEFQGRRAYEVGGEKIIPCPAQTSHRTCTECRLCFDDSRLPATIGFELHGIPFAIRAARAALRTPHDPMRRLPSEERIRIIRDRYLRIEGREPAAREVAKLIDDLSPASIYEWLRFLRGEIIHPAERRRLARGGAR